MGVCLLVTGCTSGWMPPDIQSNETLNTLGAAGYQRLCSAFEGYVRDEYSSNYFVQAICLYEGVTTTTSAIECGDAVNACTETMPPAAESLLSAILAQASCSTIGINPTGCAATVAQVKACLDAIEDQLKSLEFAATCAVAGQQVDDNWWRIPLPAACESLRTICPP